MRHRSMNEYYARTRGQWRMFGTGRQAEPVECEGVGNVMLIDAHCRTGE